MAVQSLLSMMFVHAYARQAQGLFCCPPATSRNRHCIKLQPQAGPMDACIIHL